MVMREHLIYLNKKGRTMKKILLLLTISSVLMSTAYGMAKKNDSKYIVNYSATALDVIIDYDDGNATALKTLMPYNHKKIDISNVLEFPSQFPGSEEGKGFPTKVTIFYPSATAATALKSTIDLPKPTTQDPKKGATEYSSYRIYTKDNFLKSMTNQLEADGILIKGS